MQSRTAYSRWEHAVKLDPDRNNDDRLIEAVLESGCDAVIIGGTQGISRSKVVELFKKVSAESSIPVAVELSSPDIFFWGADFYFLPIVLNSSDPDWLIRRHARALEAMLSPLLLAGGRAGRLNDAVIPEGYIVLNPDSSVCSLTDADYSLNGRQCASLALAGELFFKLPVIYIEYSGTYGSPEVVHAVRLSTSSAHLFYGGGIETPQQAYEMSLVADTVILGNMVYEGGLSRLKETVQAVREAKDDAFWR